MHFTFLDYKPAGGVSVIEVKGWPSAELTRLADELEEVCREITYDDETRLALLLLTEGPSGPASDPGEECSIAAPISGLDKPVLAASTGDCIGRKLELMLAGDLRIGSETSRFGLTHILSGQIPGDGGTQRLARLVGKGKALEMILTGQVVDAREAHLIGLINRTFPAEGLVSAATAMAEEMAQKAPISLRYAKEAVNKGMDMTLEQGLRLEADLYLLLHTTQDRTEGIKGFIEKRKVQFQGK